FNVAGQTAQGPVAWDVLTFGGSLRAAVVLPAAGLRSTLASAPAAGECYRIHSVMSDTGGDSFYLLDGAGATTVIGICTGGDVVPLQGQLCFGSIMVQTIAAGGTAYVTYDLFTPPIL